MKKDNYIVDDYILWVTLFLHSSSTDNSWNHGFDQGPIENIPKGRQWLKPNKEEWNHPNDQWKYRKDAYYFRRYEMIKLIETLNDISWDYYLLTYLFITIFCCRPCRDNFFGTRNTDCKYCLFPFLFDSRIDGWQQKVILPSLKRFDSSSYGQSRIERFET